MKHYWRRMHSDRALEIRTDTTPADPGTAIRSVLFPDGDVITQIGAHADAAQRRRHRDQLAAVTRRMQRNARRTIVMVEAALFALAGLVVLIAWLSPLASPDRAWYWTSAIGLASTAALGFILRIVVRMSLARYITRAAGTGG